MRMLSRADAKTLAFSFFFFEQGHTYENIWAWIRDSVASCSRPGKYNLDLKKGGKKKKRSGMNNLPKIYNRSDFL